MQELKRFQVRGVPGDVQRTFIADRTVDFWLPREGASHLLVAHDGQNVFDGRTSTHRGQTWKMAQSALRVSKKLECSPPAIIAIWHSSSKTDPWGRAKDLTPQDFFTPGQYINPQYKPDNVTIDLHANNYLQTIFSTIVPTIAPDIKSQNTAMIGSSMGGLATLYALAKHPQHFSTALALSPHWTLSDETLVEKMIAALPATEPYKVWMSRGTKGLDRDYEPLQNLADDLMRKRGYTSRNFHSQVYSRSGHNEKSWARYLDEPLRFWLSS